MRRSLTLVALALGAASPAFAQDGLTEGWDLDARLTLVGSGVGDENVLTPAGAALLASGSLLVTRTDTFDNGLALDWRGEVRLERDAKSRPAFAGSLGNCPGVNGLCPSVTDGLSFFAPVSPVTGLAADGPLADEDGFATVESASLGLTGPWGEGIIGLDSGAAARLDARAPTVLQRVSAFSSGLDPTGLVVTRARNDVTGSSFKATYMTPRWVGFRLGASYTPKADMRTADFDPDYSAPGVANAGLENVLEGGASFARQFAEQGLRVRTALTYTMAESGAGLTGFGDYEALGAGLELESGKWTTGLRWLSSNSAQDSGNGDYQGWELGLIRESGDWRVGLEAGWSEDQLTTIEGVSWLVGASKKINEHANLGVAWTSGDIEVPVLQGAGIGLGHTNAGNQGLVFELTVRN
ncbi:MAG: porin [Hyphomonadaceae bacterium]|nr:porin [Hyphomonadaceae bacterium]